MPPDLNAEFLQDIAEHPDDDAPRLIFADWLDENGAPARAEFIRLQCRLARLDEDDPARQGLLEREEDLLAAHRERWLEDLPRDLCEVDGHLPRFERGFPSSLTVDCAAFCDRGEELFDLVPVDQIAFKDVVAKPPAAPRTLVLRGRTIVVPARSEPTERGRKSSPDLLAACPHLGRVRRLSLVGDTLSGAHLATILASPHIVTLTELSLSDKIGQSGATAVESWPKAEGLRSLSFSFGAIGPLGAAVLAASRRLRNLTELRLHGCFIGTPGAQALARSTTLTGLKTLLLGYNQIGLDGLAELLASPVLDRVDRLEIGYNGPNDIGPGDEGVRLLISSPVLARLDEIDLGESQVTAEGARLIGGTSGFVGVRRLDLSQCPLGDAGVEHLASSPHLGGLRRLKLSQTGIGDAALIALAASEHLNPRALELDQNTIGGAGLSALAKSRVLESVEELNLWRCPVGSDGAAALARSTHALSLRELRLSNCQVGDEAIFALAEASWGGLRELELHTNPISDAAGSALAASPLLAGVRKFSISSTQIADQTARALAASPHVRSLRDLGIGHSKITDEGALAIAASPYLGGLNRMIVWSNPVTRVGMEALWTRFGDRVYPQRKQLEAPSPKTT